MLYQILQEDAGGVCESKQLYGTTVQHVPVLPSSFHGIWALFVT